MSTEDITNPAVLQLEQFSHEVEPFSHELVTIALDEVAATAVEVARAAAEDAAGQPVGEHCGAAVAGVRIVTHSFAADVPGYTGWRWSVTVVRTADSERVTVDEVVLLPGDDALLAPSWVPWSERVRHGDLTPGDLMPPPADDPRLVPAYLESDDPAVEAVSYELGIGRVRVMSRDGRLDAAQRWYDGDCGPDTAMARHAPGRCGTCGFYLPLAGSLAAGFGACGNEIASADGRVVSLEHGCGAHSETIVEPTSLADRVGDVYDDESFV